MLISDAWQGISGITGILSLLFAIFTLWLTVDRIPQHKIKSLKNSWYIITLLLSLFLLAYAVFALSIFIINYLVKNPKITLNNAVYSGTAIASIFGVVVGIIWTTISQRVLNSQHNSKDIQSNRG